MQSHVQSLLSLFSAHPALALALVFAGAMLEALAVVGSVIPGSTAVFVGGTLIGLGVRNRLGHLHGHLDPGMHVLTKPFELETLARRAKELIESD